MFFFLGPCHEGGGQYGAGKTGRVLRAHRPTDHPALG